MSEPLPALIDKMQGLLHTQAGYLRNTIREHLVTCAVCTTPVDGYDRCFQCNDHFRVYGDRLADATAFLAYGVARRSLAMSFAGTRAPLQSRPT